jgi:hypothetical protein
MVIAPDVTVCSNLTCLRAPLIATLEGQRYQRGYDFSTDASIWAST